MINVDSILNRIKTFKKYKTDADLAKRLGVEPHTVSTWRKRETIPHEKLITFCDTEGISLDWLLTGKGPVKRRKRVGRSIGKAHPREFYDPQLLREIVETVEEIFQREHLSLRPAKKAELITLLYEELQKEEAKRSELQVRAERLIKLAS